jgi:hypothetical protein
VSSSFRVLSSNHHSHAATACLHHRSTLYFRHHAIYFCHRHLYHDTSYYCLFAAVSPSEYNYVLVVPSDFTRAVARVRELSSVASQKKIEKNLKKRKKIRKSQIRIQIGLTALSTSPVRNQSELDSFVSFDSFGQQTLTSHNFCIRTSFSTCDHSKLSKESGKDKFLASKVSDPEILCDLHLYLAVELFLCACCVAP